MTDFDTRPAFAHPGNYEEIEDNRSASEILASVDRDDPLARVPTSEAPLPVAKGIPDWLPLDRRPDPPRYGLPSETLLSKIAEAEAVADRVDRLSREFQELKDARADEQRLIEKLADEAVTSDKAFKMPKRTDWLSLLEAKAAESRAVQRAGDRALDEAARVERAELPAQGARLAAAVKPAWDKAVATRTFDAVQAWYAAWQAAERIRLDLDPTAPPARHDRGAEVQTIIGATAAMERLLADGPAVEVLDGSYHDDPAEAPMQLRTALLRGESQSDYARLVELEFREGYRTTAYTWAGRYLIPGVDWNAVEEPPASVPRHP